MSEHARRHDEPEPLAGEGEERRDAELRDTRELAAAREDFAHGIRKLPAIDRLRVLADDLAGPRRGRRWSLEKLEACWQRLRALERSTDDTALSLRVARLAVHKRRIERLRDRIVMDNLRLVPHLVRKLGREHQIPFMDLVQEGNLGLMRAVDRFDPEMGNRFSTYAYWWIRHAIYKALDEKSRMIRLPAHVVNSCRTLRNVQRLFQEEHDRAPTAAEVAERLGITERKARELLSLVVEIEPQPLELFGAEDDHPSLHDRLPADEPSALETMLDAELCERLKAAMNLLTEREEAIVRLRFGIGRRSTQTLREIGQMLGLSRERVRQVERAALAKISAAENEVFGRGHAMTA